MIMKFQSKIKLIILFGVVAFILMFLLPSYSISYLSAVFLFGILAAALDFTWGYSGILVFGPAIFFGLGSYISAIGLKEGWSIFSLLMLAYFFVLALSFLVFIPSFYRKMQDIQFGLISLIISLIFQQVAISLYDLTGGSNGINNFVSEDLFFLNLQIPLNNTSFMYMVSLSFSILLLLLFAWLEETNFGKLLVSIRDNPKRMESIGFSLPKYQSISFIILGLIGVTTGFIYAPITNIVHPSIFSVTTNVVILVWIAIGGRGTILGPFLAAIILKIIEFQLGSQLQNYYILLIGILLVSSVLFFRKGLYFHIGEMLRKIKFRRNAIAD